MANKESICGAYCPFSYFQTGLGGSGNTDVWGIGVGTVVAVPQAFHVIWGLGLVPQPLWQEGVLHFQPLGKKDKDQRAVTTS